jgi:ketosteroid isomerase-like protein
MEEHSNAALARKGVEAFAAGDIAGATADWADDVVWHVPGNHRWSGTYTGKPAVMDFLMQSSQDTQRGIEVHDVVGNDDHVVALVRLTLTKGGASASGESAWVMHVRDGQMKEFWAINSNQPEIDKIMA